MPKLAQTVLVLVGILSAWCQQRAIRQVPTVASPTTPPEPILRVAESPTAIFQALTGPSSANRRRAIIQLGWKDDEAFADDPTFLGNARLYRVNLDDDPEMEIILVFDIGVGRETRLLIFKSSQAEWYRIGAFTLWYMWGPDDAEHMLELRNIIDFDHKDIIIRLTAGGSDIQKEVELSIYRIYDGRLYRTFHTTERFALRRFSERREMVIDDERHHIFYPDLVQGTQPYIVVRHTKELVPESAWGVTEKPAKTLSCVPYRWDPIKYVFTADRSTSAMFCESSPTPQKHSPVKQK
jgi:hypothetical protein